MSISPEGHVSKPDSKTNKLPTWVIITIVVVAVLLVVACCLAVVVVLLTSFMAMPTGNWFTEFSNLFLFSI